MGATSAVRTGAFAAQLRWLCGFAATLACAQRPDGAPVSPVHTPAVEIETEVVAAPTGVSPRGDARSWRAALRDGRVALRIDGFVVARGATSPLVTAVLFGDFTDRGSATLAAGFEAARVRWPDDVRVEFVHVPAVTRALAQDAAQVAIEAGRSGRFWAMHDRLFATEVADREALVAAAQELGLGREAVLQALADGVHRPWIDANTSAARALGIGAAGVGFVNGRAAPLDVDGIVALVDDERAAIAALVREGLPRAAIREEILASAAPPTPGPPASATAGGPDPAVNYAIAALDRPVLGPRDAPVTVIVFSDFQCPFCARVQPVLEQLRAAHPDDVRIVFRNLPLPFHRHARELAKLALAVDALAPARGGARSKFWRFHDLLFARKELGEANWKFAAKRVGLDPKRIAKASLAAAIEAAIVRDEEDARAFGVSGTPTFFVNGRVLVGAQGLESFEALVREELAKAQLFAKDDPGGSEPFYDRLTQGFAPPPS